MTLAEDTIYNVKERLCADTKDVVGSKNIKPDIRSAFVVRRWLFSISHTASWCWSVEHAIAAYIKFIKNVFDSSEMVTARLSINLK